MRYILSLTTHDGRFSFVKVAIRSIQACDDAPYKVVININRNDLSEENERLLKESLSCYDNIVYNHTELKTVWKKFVPTMDLFPGETIVNIDDDIIYKTEDILYCKSKFEYMNMKRPVSATRWRNKHLRLSPIQHCGALSVSNSKLFIGRSGYKTCEEALRSQNERYMQLASSDTFYTAWYRFVGNPVVSCGKGLSTKFVEFSNGVGWSAAHPLCVSVMADAVNGIGFNSKTEIRRDKTFSINIPWCCNGGLLQYYDKMIRTSDADYVGFVDGDAMFLCPDFGDRLYEDFDTQDPDLLVMMTNRVANPYQLVHDIERSSNDIEYHRSICAKMCMNAIEYVGDRPMSGVGFFVKKSFWNDEILDSIKCETKFLGVDNAIFNAIKNAGGRIFLSRNQYLYHWYRGGNKKKTKHLE